MALMLILITALIGLCFIYYALKWMKWSKMPPGPWGLPFVGYAPFMDRNAPHDTFTKLSKKYGPAISLNIAGIDQVVISDWELVRETFNKHEFNHRPDFLLFKLAAEGHNGIIAGSGKLWQDNRRFVMRTLRDFGFGKNILDEIITSEAKSVAKIFASHQGKPFDVDNSLNVAILNIIWNMCAGQHYEHDNPEVRKLMEKFNSVTAGIGDLGPFSLRPGLVPFFPKFAKILEKLKADVKFVTSTMMRQVVEHKETLQDGSPRDLIDAYLQERARLIERGEDASNFSDLQLRVNVQALFIAGSDTTSTTIRWAILYLARSPEAQKKCHEELDRVVGRDRLPSLELDKDKLPYLEATIHEVQRLANVAPTGVPHAAFSDTPATIGQYTIPAGTWVLANIYGCHTDPKFWPEPKKFDPSRFLNADGTPKEKVPSFLPFSLGKRQCLGESLAKMELFLFLAVLLQKFQFKHPDNSELPDLDTVDARFIIRKPPPFEICAIER